MRYGHQVVVANDLHRRKQEVCLIERRSSNAAKNGKDENPGFAETWLRLSQLMERQGEARHQPEIEELIIEELLKRHEAWLKR
jgi:phosphopantothenate-cysteine ligase